MKPSPKCWLIIKKTGCSTVPKYIHLPSGVGGLVGGPVVMTTVVGPVPGLAAAVVEPGVLGGLEYVEPAGVSEGERSLYDLF